MKVKNLVITLLVVSMLLSTSANVFATDSSDSITSVEIKRAKTELEVGVLPEFTACVPADANYSVVEEGWYECDPDSGESPEPFTYMSTATSNAYFVFGSEDTKILTPEANKCYAYYVVVKGESGNEDLTNLASFKVGATTKSYTGSHVGPHTSQYAVIKDIVRFSTSDEGESTSNEDEPTSDEGESTSDEGESTSDEVSNNTTVDNNTDTTVVTPQYANSIYCFATIPGNDTLKLNIPDPIGISFAEKVIKQGSLTCTFDAAKATFTTDGNAIHIPITVCVKVDPAFSGKFEPTLQMAVPEGYASNSVVLVGTDKVSGYFAPKSTMEGLKEFTNLPFVATDNSEYIFTAKFIATKSSATSVSGSVYNESAIGMGTSEVDENGNYKMVIDEVNSDVTDASVVMKDVAGVGRVVITKVDVPEKLKTKSGVKRIYDITAMSGEEVVKVSDNEIKITLPLDEELKGYKAYKVVYIVDGQIVEDLGDAKIVDNKIVFTTTHLSEYGIIPYNPGSPKTGDNIMLSVYVLGFAVVGIIVCLYKKYFG